MIKNFRWISLLYMHEHLCSEGRQHIPRAYKSATTKPSSTLIQSGYYVRFIS